MKIINKTYGTADFEPKFMICILRWIQRFIDQFFTLIFMREGTFIPLYFLDWILSAEILFNLLKHFGGENLHPSG